MKRVLEIGVLTAAILVTVGLACYLLYEGLLSEKQAPRLSVSIQRVGPAEGDSAASEAEFRVDNRGTISVSEATVEVTATLPDGSEESEKLTFRFLPKGGSRSGTVRFAADVSHVKGRVVSYQLP